MKIKLHYARLGIDKISEVNFESFKDIQIFFERKAKAVMLEKNIKGNYKESDRVYLFTYNDLLKDSDGDPEIIITEKIYFIADLFAKGEYFSFDLLNVFYLQEYESYEDAYKVALDMKEPNKLCYNVQDN